MKQKDVIYLVLAVGIFLVAGYLGYTQLVPKKAASSNTVEVQQVGAIPAALDATGLSQLSDASKVTDYNEPVDLTGLNNAAPFGQ